MKLTKLRTIASMFTVAAVAGVVALAIPANGAGTANNRFITVTGVGTISVVPDAVRFNATVSTVRSTNAAALSAATNSAAAVRAALKTAGIATKDVRSANISVYPEYNWTEVAGTKITGYRASQSFDVLVPGLSKYATRPKILLQLLLQHATRLDK
jgi:uncharacterized protein YggE